MILNFPFPFAMYIFLNIERTDGNKYNARTLNYNWKARFQEKRAITEPIVKSTKANLIIAKNNIILGKYQSFCVNLNFVHDTYASIY